MVSHYGYLGIFSLLMLGMFGIPFPDESLLTFSGYLASKGHLNIWLTILTAFLGSIVGVTVNYVVGRTVGLVIIRKYGHYLRLTPAKMNKAGVWFDWFGKWTLPVSYFIPGLRHVAPFCGGRLQTAVQGFCPLCVCRWIFVDARLHPDGLFPGP